MIVLTVLKALTIRFFSEKSITGRLNTVNCEIPLNRYSFFEALEDKLLPNTKIELNIEIENDNNLIWQASNNCRAIIVKLRLLVPKMIFSAETKVVYGGIS